MLIFYLIWELILKLKIIKYFTVNRTIFTIYFYKSSIKKLSKYKYFMEILIFLKTIYNVRMNN